MGGITSKKGVLRKPSSKRTVARPGTRRRDGCTATVRIEERQGASVDTVTAAIAFPVAGGSIGRTRRRNLTLTARRLAAAGHPKRLAILTLLLEGPAVYRALQRATGLAAGPLYHHINQLRLAGLILPKQRDLYELTRCGRNVILLAGVLDQLGSDQRRRIVSSDSEKTARVET